jgi:hypothetical protein
MMAVGIYRDVASSERQPPRIAREGRAYITVIGIDRYRTWNRLSNAVSDAKGALNLFAGVGFELVAPALFDESATGDALRRLVIDDLSGLGEEDSLVLFFAGHGHTVARTYGGASVRDGYLIPADGDRPGGRAATWIRLDSWLTDITRIPAKHILVILDACHSGLALGPILQWRSRGMENARREPLEQLRVRRSRRIITSALDDQLAMDGGPVPGHSLFTGCLIESMTGGLAASTGHHIVTGSEIGYYVQRRVSEYPGSVQTPDFGALELDDRGELLVHIRGARARVAQAIEGAVTGNEPYEPGSAAPELPGGLVARRSPFYVARPLVDEACLREVLRPGALIRIKGPHQMGKSSLMMGIAEHAARSGARTVTVNLQMADAAMLGDQDRFLRWLCAVVTRRLQLPLARIGDHWDDIFGAKDNCTAYFEEHLLPGGPLVIALDEVDRLFDSPATAEETLALGRAWHEMGKTASPWAALRLVLSYSTEMYLPLHTNHSPFNVGLPVVLGEWDGAIVHDLARRHGLVWGRGEVEQLMALIGGHPHLVRIALYHVARGMSLDAVLATAATDEGIFADHLRHLLWHVQCRADLREAAARVMESSEPVRLSTELAFKLVSLGLANFAGNEVQPARALYRTYFRGNLETV